MAKSLDPWQNLTPSQKYRTQALYDLPTEVEGFLQKDNYF